MARSLIDELRAAPPPLHGAGDEFWGLAWPALAWLERNVGPGMRTLEVGSGASTLVFAARGAEHVAVTPDADEEKWFRAECERRAIDASGVRFSIGLSHEVLPQLDHGPLDLALVDGAHGFPYPVLDWWHIAPHVALGGRVLLDDAYMPPVAAVVHALRALPQWQVEGAVGDRTVIARKLADGLPPFDWEAGSLRFDYLPPLRRFAASARHRVFTTSVGLRAVELARRRTGLRFRRRG